MNGSSIKWRAVFWLLVLATVEVLFVAGIGLIFSAIAESRDLGPEAFLTLLLLAGIVAFVAMLTTAVAVLAALNLTDRTQSFGLPEGTIRAIIALSLIIIFAMSSVYLFSQLSAQRQLRIVGLTAEQVAAIPGPEIMSTKINADDPDLRDIERRLPMTESSQDFAQQILTTTGTLVVAVSAFYFGAKSVAAARGAAESPSLRILRPTDTDVALGSEEKSIPIRLESRPPGLAIEGKVDGEISKALTQVSHDEFVYARPGTTPVKPIQLTFTLVGNPEIRKSVTINFDRPKEPLKKP